MSLNKYDSSTGELINIASGQRTWVGTRAAYDAAKQAGTLPNNCLIAITDDEEDYCHYSTEETKTGNYWIDGKPIYRIVVDVGQLPNNTTKNVLHNISDFDTSIDYRIIAKAPASTDGRCIKIGQYCYADESVYVDDTRVRITTKNDLTQYYGYAIIEYTKDTD